MLAKFPDPQPKFVEEPEPDWWLIAIRIAMVFVALLVIYMSLTLYFGRDLFHVIREVACVA